MFDHIHLESSNIHNNAILDFGTILKGCIGGFTNIYRNYIANISKSFIRYASSTSENTITDSWISYNYLNANPNYNVTMFDCGYDSYATIDNNFIDFCKYIYNQNGGGMNVKFTNNQFDVFFRFSKTRIAANFINNTFAKSNKETYITRFVNADSDMQSNDWGCFFEPLFASSLNSNIVYQCDNYYIMNAAFSNKNLKIKNTTFIDIKKPIKDMYKIHYYLDITDDNDCKNIVIDDLNYIKVTELPEINLNENIYFYDGQIVDYNGKIIRAVVNTYNDTKWVDCLGNTVTM